MKPMLAKKFEGQNIKGWLMSEKLDGVRALWTGSDFLSRNGKKFFAPAWFTDQLPTGEKLDGELYITRGAFQQTVSVVRKKKPIDAEWKAVHYYVFDAPECKGGFESRLKFCSEILAGCAVAKVVKHEVCKSRTHLDEFFSGLVSIGAEGVMLRRTGSAYEPCRSCNLLKYKPFDSEEAEVIGHQTGEGKHLNRLGALICRWQHKIFNLGTGFSDALRESPPGINSRVSFIFQGLTDDGIPRFPVFLAERNYE